jgi:hypothetical protein
VRRAAFTHCITDFRKTYKDWVPACERLPLLQYDIESTWS